MYIKHKLYMGTVLVYVQRDSPSIGEMSPYCMRHIISGMQHEPIICFCRTPSEIDVGSYV